MARLPAYQYSSLEFDHDGLSTTPTDFRLLVLDSGEPADEVSCTLAPHCLASAPDYEAISYVWGDPTDTCDLICSGQRLSITISLYSALQGFRLASRKRTLWADAICINQKDLDERGAQVSIMNKIFSQGRQVLIWLGEETPYDSEALDIVLRLEKILPVSSSDDAKDINALYAAPEFSRLVEMIPSSYWLQIGYLLRKPWFQRVWVIQEVLVATTAQLFNGSKSIPWSNFADIMERLLICRLGPLLSDALPTLENILLMHPQNLEGRRPFFRLLSSARNFQSTDLRDKLYALLGVSDTATVVGIRPDYNIQVQDVFTQYTKQELTRGSLAHLAATNYTDVVARVTVPTWVPDWSRPVDRLAFEALDVPFNAGGSTTPPLDFSTVNDLLIIKGKKVSSIRRLGSIQYSELTAVAISTLEAATRRSQVARWLQNWLNDCHKVAFGDDFSPTQQTFDSESYHKFCEALCCDINMDGETPPLKTTVECLSKFYLLLTQSLELQPSTRPVVDQNELQITGLQADRFVASWSYNRYFCSDDSSRLGWVSNRAQVNDVFCIFLGARVPHLLRPVTDGRYELIGECYLQGCMNGEIMESDDFAVEEFVLV